MYPKPVTFSAIARWWKGTGIQGGASLPMSIAATSPKVSRQKAMATAMAFPNGSPGKRNDLKPLDLKSEGYEFSEKTLSRARYVLRNSPMMEGERYPRRWRSIAPITKTETQRQGKRQWRLRWCFRMESGAAIERRIVSNHFKMI